MDKIAKLTCKACRIHGFYWLNMQNCHVLVAFSLHKFTIDKSKKVSWTFPWSKKKNGELAQAAIMLQLIEYSLKVTSTVVEIFRYSSFIFVASECCFFLFEKNTNISCGLFPKFMLFHSFFFPLSLFCFLLFLFSFYRFRCGSFFPHGYSRCEMRWLKVSFVSDFPSPNLIILILCASREARITKKFSLRARILLKSWGTEFSVICYSPFVR